MLIDQEIKNIEKMGIKFDVSTLPKGSGIGWMWVNFKNENFEPIGKISYKINLKTKEIMETYLKYSKPYDCQYSVQDKIYFKLKYYLDTGDFCDIDSLVEDAKKVQERIYNKRKEFCDKNPKMKKSKSGELVPKRRKCVRRNLRNILGKLINEKRMTMKQEIPRLLKLAIKENNLEVVKFALDHDIDVNINNNELIQDASTYGHLSMVKLLIAKGADMQAQGNSPLLLACNQGHKDVVKFLLANGADAYVDNGKPLIWAKENKCVKVIKILEEHMENKKPETIKIGDLLYSKNEIEERLKDIKPLDS